jgi:uncharacterized hydrophobic protein (TIGR00271 family)
VLVHLRLTVPGDLTQQVSDLLIGHDCTTNVTVQAGVVRKPRGDLVECDVAREEAGSLLRTLDEMELDQRGGILIETPTGTPFQQARRLETLAPGHPDDAVIWEAVEAQAYAGAVATVSYLLFLVFAVILAAIAVLTDSAVLVVGAMVVGPEFGPIAGFSVAVVELRKGMAKRSLTALAIGFPLGIAASFTAALIFKSTGIGPDEISDAARPLTGFISDPNFFSFFVAYLAGTAGVLSLTSAKSGALIGVLISVTTIPAAANIGVAAAYQDWSEMGGALAQLGLNLVAINLAGITTLFIQRRVYMARRRAHLDDSKMREAGGLPVGRSRHRKVLR